MRTRIRKNIGWALASCFLCLLFSGCTDAFDSPNNGGKGEGRLLLSGIQVESVVGDIQTRASLDESVLPTSGQFTITIMDNGTENVVKTLDPGTTECFLAEGSYRAIATYGEKAGMSKIPYFLGESEAFTISEGASQQVSITATLQSAVIRPQIAAELEAQYTKYTLTIEELPSNAENEEEGVAHLSSTLENGQDFFVKGGEDWKYTLTLAGTNQLGEQVSHTWSYPDLVARTRYNIQCNPDLPAFTLPEQPEGNVWSTFMYITPMTAENMTAHQEMAEKVIDNVAYEASLDGENWNLQAEPTDDGRYVIKGLEPSTNYTIRSRFGAVLSENTRQITTESAQQLENGDMEQWSRDVFKTYGLKEIYLYYPGESSTDKSWSTKNPLTMNGVTNGTHTGTNNQKTAYRWNSCTIPTDDAVLGKAAEIRTMALANFAINSGSVGASGKREQMVKNVLNSCNVYTGILYIGAVDVNSSNLEPNEYGVAHSARPLSVSFNYKYAPIKDDECKIYAVVYDENQTQIAKTDVFVSNTALDAYAEKILTFDYTGNEDKKAASIFIMFQSGVKTTTDYIKHIEGTYSGAFGIKNPWPDDVFVGSVLKIDNVTLNYEYE